MKKRLLQILSIAIFFVLVWLCGTQNVKEHVLIEDERLPLDITAGTLLCEQEEDITVIPDKYNTGAKGELIPVTGDCYISGVQFKTGQKLNLYYQPKGVEIPNTIVVENYDFSSGSFLESDVDKVTKAVTIIYRNCKFGSYIIRGDGSVKRQFENCTFTHFAGSNSTFVNCYFGGGADGDGIDPMQNCTFTNCMIADLLHPAETAGKQHIDGLQIFGSTDGVNNENIVLNNCRFEVPGIPMTYVSGELNCPITFTMRHSNANNIVFNDCYVNGGYYYGLMVLKYEQNITNLTIKNMHIGGASKNLYRCDPEFESMISNNVSATDSLYVASVRKMNDGIHLSVTNDTASERVLSVLTSKGIEHYVVSPCYKALELEMDTVCYDDYPFDEEVIISDVDWVACFDSTDTIKQIRYVNWTNEAVYVNLDEIFPARNKNEADLIIPEQKNPEYEYSDKTTGDEETKLDDKISQVYQGICGDDIQYVLEDGVLTLSGEGKTYNYSSGKTAPWYEVRELVKELVVESGITCLGNQLMSECSNLTKVILPEGLTAIGSNVFRKCSSIDYILIPTTLKNVGKRSFTSSVGRVEFGGTTDEWNQIIFDTYNDGILNAEIICETILDSGVCGDNAEWCYTSMGRLIISGEGKTYNYHSGNTPPWYGYASDIREISIEEGITNIGNLSFRDCKNVYEVNLPKTVTSVGINAFSRCKGLCEITFTSSVTSIGKNAFAATQISKVYYYGTQKEWEAIEGNSLANIEVVYK